MAEARRDGVRVGTVTDAFAELREWDLLVLPTRREPFGLVLIEAMAMRPPVVARRIDGPLEIVTPDTGILVDADDARARARRSWSWPATRRAGAPWATAGRARVESEFTLEHQAEGVHRAYLEAARVRP